VGKYEHEYNNLQETTGKEDYDKCLGNKKKQRT
jgi:hypothetical protein